MNQYKIPENQAKGRQCFVPKMPEVKTQCASCPFRVGNAKEFSDVVFKLHQNGLCITVDPEQMRESVLRDGMLRGEFYCHCTVYDKNMQKTSFEEWRQCAGATRWFKEGKR